MASDDTVSNDLVVSNSENRKKNTDNIAERQDTMVKGKPKLTISMSNTTRRSVVDHAMPSENTRAERAPDTQETLSESLQKGFSQLTE